MTAKIQKSSDLGEIWYYYRHDKNKEHIFEWWSIFVSSFKRIRCLEWI
jgi:hypothetical protein